VVLNEVKHWPASSQGIINTGAEYIELYNPTCDPIDLSCYIIGTGYTPDANPGSSFASGGSIILPQGATIAAKSHYVIGTSNSSSNPLAVDFKTDLNTSNYCTTGRGLLLLNNDSWVALYSPNGTAVDAIYWTVSANQSTKISTNDDDLNDNPCTPSSIAGCNTTGIVLASATQIYSSNPSVINYVGATTTNPSSPSYKTFSRIPDGGSWQNEIAPSIDGVNCNNGICDTPSAPTCNGTATATPSGGSGSYSYLWNDALTQTTATATGLCAGNYCVKITDLVSLCTTEKCVTVSDSPILGTDTIVKDQFNFYPNPVIDLLTFTNSKNMTSIKLYDVFGKLIDIIHPNSKIAKLDMSRFSSAMYIILLESEEKTQLIKVIKQ
jgi:hypothetical protein